MRFITKKMSYIYTSTTERCNDKSQRVNDKSIDTYRPVYHPYARDKNRTRVISFALVLENIPKYHIKTRNSSNDGEKNVILHISKMVVIVYFHR